LTRAEPTRQTQPAGRPARPGLHALVDPLAWILALAGFFDGISDNWLHALFLLGAAVAVWWDEWLTATGRPLADAPPLLPHQDARGRRPVVLTACALAVVYAVAVGGLERYTWPTTFAILLPAAVALVAAWRGPLYERAEPPRVSRVTVLGWWLVLVLGGLWELWALLLQPSLALGSIDHPTISFMMDTVLASHLGRTVTLLCWLALGWWLLSLAPSRLGAVPEVAASAGEGAS
jgi:hypothetical protein